MWSRVLGLSNDKQEDSSSTSKKRKDDTQSQRKRTESTVTSTSARKPSQGDERDRGFNPTSTSYSSTSRSPYPGAASASVASSYATAPSNGVDATIAPADLVRNPSLANQMPKSKSGRDERDRGGDRDGKSGRRRDRSSSRDRKVERQDRSRSRDREERKKERREKRERRREREGGIERGLEKAQSEHQGTPRAGDVPVGSGSFNNQIGAATFTQFPGQYDGGMIGPSNGQQRPPAMSEHVPDQFPGQFPSGATAPYRPPLSVAQGGPGLAADYYGDAGESVSQQPGVRPQAPSLIVGAEPHLMAASPIAAPPIEPSTTGGVGAAASFFSAASFQSPSSTPMPGEQPTLPAVPHQKPPITGHPGNFAAPAALAGSAAVGYMASTHGDSSTAQRPPNSSFPPTSGDPAPYTLPPGSGPPGNSYHSASAPVIPTLGSAAVGAAAGYMVGSHTSQQHQSSLPPSHGGTGSYGPSGTQQSSVQFEISHDSYPGSTRPPKPGKSSPPSNIPLYAAGAVGAAGLAAAAYHHNHQSQTQSASHSQHQVSHSGRPYPSTTMVQQHRHHGPLDKFVDFFRDPEGVARFEEYTEYIGVCRYCFEPGSSPRDAPRKHHYRKRRSNERLGASMRVDKDSRYGVSDGESRRKKNDSWFATGLAGYGLAKVGKTLFTGDPNDDHSARTGHANHSTTSLQRRRYSNSPSRRSSTSYGVIRKSSDAKLFHRSRSRSRDRKSGRAEAAVGAVIGASVLASGSQSKQKERRSQYSPKEETGIFGGFFSSPPEPERRRSSHKESKKKKKKNKKNGFFNFNNSSSTSSDLGLVTGTGSDRSRRKKSSKPRIKDHNDANAALIGLGAAAAALAAAEGRKGDKGKRKADVVAVKEVRYKDNRKHELEKENRNYSGPAQEETIWVDASAEEGYSSIDSMLAYGLSRRRSQDSLSSDSSGMAKWGWRWGSKSDKKKKKDSTRKESRFNHGLEAAAGLVGVTTGAAVLSHEDRRDPAIGSTGSLPPLQHVYPISTSDPSHYDATRHDSVTSASQSYQTSRPSAIPLQQPQPVAPISSVIYTSQAPYDHAYSAPAGPAVFSQQPLSLSYTAGYVIPSQPYAPNAAPRDVAPVQEIRRRDTSPTVEIVHIEARTPKRASTDLPSVQFDAVEKQEDKKRKEERHERAKSDPSGRERDHWEPREEAERRPRSKKKSNDKVEEKARREEQIDREVEQLRKEEAEASMEKNRESWVAPALTGVAGAVVGTVAAGGISMSVNRPERRREEKDGESVQRKSDEELVQRRSDEKQAAIAKRAAALIRRTPSPTVHESYSNFFVPDLQSKSKDKTPKDDSNGGNDITAYSVPDIFTVEPAERGHPSADAYTFDGAESDPKSMALPWQVPRLNLIQPTPPASMAGSIKGDASPVMRPEDIHCSDDEKAAKATVKEPTKESAKVKVTFGDSETREYEVITPEDHRNEFVDSFHESLRNRTEGTEKPQVVEVKPSVVQSPVEEVKRGRIPGQFEDDIDFAATLAAGVEASGFDPAIVIDNPTYHRRDSPPGSTSTGFYGAPFFETVTDLALDSPGTEGAPPVRGFVEGEVSPTPKDGVESRSQDDVKSALEYEIPSSPKDENPPTLSDEVKPYVARPLSDAEAIRTGRKIEKKKEEAEKIQAKDQFFVPLSSMSRNPPKVPKPQESSHPYSQDPEIIEATPRGIPRESEEHKVSVSREPTYTKPTSQSPTQNDDFYDASELQRDMSYVIKPAAIEKLATDIPLPGNDDDEMTPTPRSESKSEGRRSTGDGDDYESAEDVASTAVTAPLPDDGDERRRHKKKSKRKSSGHYEDNASVASAPAKDEDSREANGKGKKEKKGGLFGLFSKSSEPAPQNEPTRDEIDEPKRKGSKKSKDRKSKRDSGDFYSQPSESVPGLSRAAEESTNGHSHKSSKDKDERRKSRKSSKADGDSGRATQELPAKGLNTPDEELDLISEYENDPGEGTSRSREQEEPLSFLGVRREETEPPDLAGLPDPGGSDSRRMSVETAFRDSLTLKIIEESLPPLPPSRPTTPTAVGSMRDLPPLPGSVPASPAVTPAGQRRRVSMLQLSESGHAMASPSPTAVPLMFRRFPSSTGVSRSSPSTPGQSPQGPAMLSPRNRQNRPLSTEFKSSKEFRPLWLVERHAGDPSRRKEAPEEVYPSLPSSHSNSRASSVHDAERDDANKVLDRWTMDEDATLSHEPLPFDVRELDYRPDLLDSQQPTPTKDSFQMEQAIGETRNAQHPSFPTEAPFIQPFDFAGPQFKYGWEDPRKLPSLPKSNASSIYDEQSSQDISSTVRDAAAGAFAAAAAITMASTLHHDQDPDAQARTLLPPEPVVVAEGKRDMGNFEADIVKPVTEIDLPLAVKGSEDKENMHKDDTEVLRDYPEPALSLAGPEPAPLAEDEQDAAVNEPRSVEEVPVQASPEEWSGPISKKGKKEKKGKTKNRGMETFEPEETPQEETSTLSEIPRETIQEVTSTESDVPGGFPVEPDSAQAHDDLFQTPSSSKKGMKAKKDKVTSGATKTSEVPTTPSAMEDEADTPDAAVDDWSTLPTSKKGKKSKKAKSDTREVESPSMPEISREVPDEAITAIDDWSVPSASKKGKKGKKRKDKGQSSEMPDTPTVPGDSRDGSVVQPQQTNETRFKDIDQSAAGALANLQDKKLEQIGPKLMPEDISQEGFFGPAVAAAATAATVIAASSKKDKKWKAKKNRATFEEEPVDELQQTQSARDAQAEQEDQATEASRVVQRMNDPINEPFFTQGPIEGSRVVERMNRPIVEPFLTRDSTAPTEQDELATEASQVVERMNEPISEPFLTEDPTAPIEQDDLATEARRSVERMNDPVGGPFRTKDPSVPTEKQELSISSTAPVITTPEAGTEIQQDQEQLRHPEQHDLKEPVPADIELPLDDDFDLLPTLPDSPKLEAQAAREVDKAPPGEQYDPPIIESQGDQGQPQHPEQHDSKEAMPADIALLLDDDTGLLAALPNSPGLGPQTTFEGDEAPPSGQYGALTLQEHLAETDNSSQPMMETTQQEPPSTTLELEPVPKAPVEEKLVLGEPSATQPNTAVQAAEAQDTYLSEPRGIDDDALVYTVKKSKKGKKNRKSQLVTPLVESLPEEPEATRQFTEALETGKDSQLGGSAPEPTKLDEEEFGFKEQPSSKKKGKKGKKQKLAVDDWATEGPQPGSLGSSQDLVEAGVEKESQERFHENEPVTPRVEGSGFPITEEQKAVPELYNPSAVSINEPTSATTSTAKEVSHMLAHPDGSPVKDTTSFEEAVIPIIEGSLPSGDAVEKSDEYLSMPKSKKDKKKRKNLLRSESSYLNAVSTIEPPSKTARTLEPLPEKRWPSSFESLLLDEASRAALPEDNDNDLLVDAARDIIPPEGKAIELPQTPTPMAALPAEGSEILAEYGKRAPSHLTMYVADSSESVLLGEASGKALPSNDDSDLMEEIRGIVKSATDYHEHPDQVPSEQAIEEPPHYQQPLPDFFNEAMQTPLPQDERGDYFETQEREQELGLDPRPIRSFTPVLADVRGQEPEVMKPAEPLIMSSKERSPSSQDRVDPPPQQQHIPQFDPIFEEAMETPLPNDEEDDYFQPRDSEEPEGKFISAFNPSDDPAVPPREDKHVELEMIDASRTVPHIDDTALITPAHAQLPSEEPVALGKDVELGRELEETAGFETSPSKKKGKKDKKKGKSTALDWSEEVPVVIAQEQMASEPADEAGTFAKPVAVAGALVAETAAAGFMVPKKSQKEKKKGKSKALDWDEAALAETIQEDARPAIVNEPQTADDDTGFLSSKKSTKGKKMGRSSALDEEPAIEATEAQLEVGSFTKSIEAEPGTLLPPDEPSAEAEDFGVVGSKKSKKDKKKSKSKAADFDEETLVQEQQASWEPEFTRAAEEPLDEPAPTPTFMYDEPAPVADDTEFITSKKSKKDKKKKASTADWDQEQSLQEVQTVTESEPANLMEEPLDKPEPSLTLGESATGVDDAEFLTTKKSKRDKKKNKKGQAYDWSGESTGTATPAIPETLPVAAGTEDLQSRETNDITAEPIEPEPEPEATESFSLKKSRKDKKKSKKGASMSWGEESEQAPTPETTESTDKDRALFVPEENLTKVPFEQPTAEGVAKETASDLPTPLPQDDLELEGSGYFSLKKSKKDKKKAKKEKSMAQDEEIEPPSGVQEIASTDKERAVVVPEVQLPEVPFEQPIVEESAENTTAETLTVEPEKPILEQDNSEPAQRTEVPYHPQAENFQTVEQVQQPEVSRDLEPAQDLQDEFLVPFETKKKKKGKKKKQSPPSGLESQGATTLVTAAEADLTEERKDLQGDELFENVGGVAAPLPEAHSEVLPELIHAPQPAEDDDFVEFVKKKGKKGRAAKRVELDDNVASPSGLDLTATVPEAVREEELPVPHHDERLEPVTETTAPDITRDLTQEVQNTTEELSADVSMARDEQEIGDDGDFPGFTTKKKKGKKSKSAKQTGSTSASRDTEIPVGGQADARGFEPLMEPEEHLVETEATEPVEQVQAASQDDFPDFATIKRKKSKKSKKQEPLIWEDDTATLASVEIPTYADEVAAEPSSQPLETVYEGEPFSPQEPEYQELVSVSEPEHRPSTDQQFSYNTTNPTVEQSEYIIPSLEDILREEDAADKQERDPAAYDEIRQQAFERELEAAPRDETNAGEWILRPASTQGEGLRVVTDQLSVDQAEEALGMPRRRSWVAKHRKGDHSPASHRSSASSFSRSLGLLPGDIEHSPHSPSSPRSLGLLPGDVERAPSPNRESHEQGPSQTEAALLYQGSPDQQAAIDDHHLHVQRDSLKEPSEYEATYGQYQEESREPLRSSEAVQSRESWEPSREIERNMPAGAAQGKQSKDIGRAIGIVPSVGAGVALFESLARRNSIQENDKGKKPSGVRRSDLKEPKLGEAPFEQPVGSHDTARDLATVQNPPAIEAPKTRDDQYPSILSHDDEHMPSARSPQVSSLREDSDRNRDSAVHVSDSPLPAEQARFHQSMRDSGYQGTEASPTLPDSLGKAGSPREYRMSGESLPNARDIRTASLRDSGTTFESSTSIGESSENPLKISIEVDPAYDVSISRPDVHGHETVVSDVRSRDSGEQLPLHSHERLHSKSVSPERSHAESQPSPVDSSTKPRSSELFQSSPSTREDLTRSHLPQQDLPSAGIAGYQDYIGSLDDFATPTKKPTHQESLRSRDIETTHAPTTSLFGGPVGINSDLQSMVSPPRTPLSSSHRQLNTISEHSPEEVTLQKHIRAPSDSALSDHGLGTRRRSGTPQNVSKQRTRSPLAATSEDKDPVSIDDLDSRLSWPAVDEDTHSVDLEWSKSRNADAGRRNSSRHSQSPLPPLITDIIKHHEADYRSVSGASIRSNESITAIIKDQETKSPSTPTLRRVDRSVSSDLRAANKRGEAKKLAKSPEADPNPEPAIASSSTYDPLNDKGKARITKMADVYEGWGDVNESPLSPTRPASMRKRQSMQFIEMQTRLDQLALENRSLVDAKTKAERNLEQTVHDHNQLKQALTGAIESRDQFLKQKDDELNELKKILEGLHNEVSHLTEVNESLQGSSRGITSEHEQRYNRLESEHTKVHQRWQDTSRELEDLRDKHASLSGGLEGIVQHEVALALESKNVELQHMRNELDAAKQQIRALQQQILAARSSDDVLIDRDEDYFDSKCQELCQHVQQWVLRFSKFSDSKICHSINEVMDEKITDRFDNAILDGSDVDIYLKDRIKRRDVFMSVVMTMVWEYIFTRYLFGMDREQRQKLKSLEKTLSEVGPATSVNTWRATTLTMLAKRDAFEAQRQSDTEAIVHEIYDTLATLLTPPAHLVTPCIDSLRKVMSTAVDLSIEMRTQRAEYIMLPPLQPEYDTNGDLARKVFFNAALMNERSGDTTSNEELMVQRAVVRMVLFPLVVKKGDDEGVGDEEIVVCPAQVLVARDREDVRTGKKTVRMMSPQGDVMEGVSGVNQSVQSFAPSSMDATMGGRF